MAHGALLWSRCFGGMGNHRMTDHIGPYELRGELGRGAMAVVWRAWDPKLEREVAVKEPVVPPGADAAGAADMAARFVREGKAAAALNHPGIVTIYAADVYDGRPAIVMELIEGETLSEVLARGPLSAASSLAVLDQLLDAVGYAHARAVVHRDIKPDNVFVTLDGRVKLTDFGIAHMGTTAALTQAGTVMGTPGYMAPEQVTGHPVDSRADLFAIGVVGYELVTGHNPFGATDGVAPTTIMYRIVHEPMPLLPSGLSAGLPADIAGVLAVATAKDPASRFADAGAFRSALHGGPIATAPAMPAAAWNPAAAAAPSSGSSTNWTPYLIVGAVMVVAVGLMFAFAGGGVVGNTGGAAVAQTMSAEQVAQAQSEVEAAVTRWQSAWQSMDLTTYMSFYAPDFYSQYKQMDRTKWEQYKVGLFAKYSSQAIEIGSMDTKVDADGATATFEQTFTAEKFSDHGTKTLRFKRSGGAWLIVGEEFAAW